MWPKSSPLPKPLLPKTLLTGLNENIPVHAFCERQTSSCKSRIYHLSASTEGPGPSSRLCGCPFPVAPTQDPHHAPAALQEKTPLARYRHCTKPSLPVQRQKKKKKIKRTHTAITGSNWRGKESVRAFPAAWRGPQPLPGLVRDVATACAPHAHCQGLGQPLELRKSCANLRLR